MNIKNKVSKKGVYILEASIILPPLIIVMILLISIISVISTAEDAVYIMSDQHKLADIEAAYIQEGGSLPSIIISRILKSRNRVDKVLITDYSYLKEEAGIKDLISTEVRLDFSGKNPLGLISSFGVEQRVMSRAFTGLDRSSDDGAGELTEYDKSEIVYVFPNRGTKYHNRDCPFLNPASQRVFLTSEIKRNFRPCSICNSASAGLGDIVFCFFNDGHVYHLGSCNTVDKYYVEMERKDAESRGYTACLTCGG